MDLTNLKQPVPISGAGGNVSRLAALQPKTTPMVEAMTPLATSVFKATVEEQPKVFSGSTQPYEKYGVLANNLVPDLDKQRANAQSIFDKTGNMLVNAVAGEIVGGTISGFGAIIDVLTGAAFDDKPYSNVITEAGDKIRDVVKEEFPIYQRNQGEFQWSDLGDYGYYMNRLPSVVSSLSLLIPGTALTKGASLLGKGAMSIAKAGSLGTKAANIASKVYDMEKLGSYLNTGVTALGMRIGENYQEARGVSDQTKNEVADYLNNMSDADYKKWLTAHADIVAANGGSTDKEQLAQYIGGQAGDRDFYLNFGNLAFDFIQLRALNKAFKNFHAKPLDVELKGAEKAMLNKFTGTVSPSTGESISKLSGIRGAISDASKKVGHLTVAELSEGVEESVNYIGQENGLAYGRYLANNARETDDKQMTKYGAVSFNQLENYIKSPGLYDSALWGVIGGVAFHGLANAAEKIENKIKGNAPLNYNQQRLAEINGRTLTFQNMNSKLAMIRNGVDPTNPEQTTQLDQQQKDDLSDAVVNQEIAAATLRAIQVGNYDMLDKFVNNPQIKPKLIEMGLTTEDGYDAMTDKINKSMRSTLDSFKKHSSILKDANVDDAYLQLALNNNVMNENVINQLGDRIDRTRNEISNLESASTDLSELSTNNAKPQIKLAMLRISKEALNDQLNTEKNPIMRDAINTQIKAADDLINNYSDKLSPLGKLRYQQFEQKIAPTKDSTSSTIDKDIEDYIKANTPLAPETNYFSEHKIDNLAKDVNKNYVDLLRNETRDEIQAQRLSNEIVRNQKDAESFANARKSEFETAAKQHIDNAEDLIIKSLRNATSIDELNSIKSQLDGNETQLDDKAKQALDSAKETLLTANYKDLTDKINDEYNNNVSKFGASQTVVSPVEAQQATNLSDEVSNLSDNLNAQQTKTEQQTQTEQPITLEPKVVPSKSNTEYKPHQYRSKIATTNVFTKSGRIGLVPVRFGATDYNSANILSHMLKSDTELTPEYLANAISLITNNHTTNIEDLYLLMDKLDDLREVTYGSPKIDYARDSAYDLKPRYKDAVKLVEELINRAMSKYPNTYITYEEYRNNIDRGLGNNVYIKKYVSPTTDDKSKPKVPTDTKLKIETASSVKPIKSTKSLADFAKLADNLLGVELLSPDMIGRTYTISSPFKVDGISVSEIEVNGNADGMFIDGIGNGKTVDVDPQIFLDNLNSGNIVDTTEELASEISDDDVTKQNLYNNIKDYNAKRERVSALIKAYIASKDISIYKGKANISFEDIMRTLVDTHGIRNAGLLYDIVKAVSIDLANMSNSNIRLIDSKSVMSENKSDFINRISIPKFQEISSYIKAETAPAHFAMNLVTKGFKDTLNANDTKLYKAIFDLRNGDNVNVKFENGSLNVYNGDTMIGNLPSVNINVDGNYLSTLEHWNYTTSSIDGGYKSNVTEKLIDIFNNRMNNLDFIYTLDNFNNVIDDKSEVEEALNLLEDNPVYKDMIDKFSTKLESLNDRIVRAKHISKLLLYNKGVSIIDGSIDDVMIDSLKDWSNKIGKDYSSINNLYNQVKANNNSIVLSIQNSSAGKFVKNIENGKPAYSNFKDVISAKDSSDYQLLFYDRDGLYKAGTKELIDHGTHNGYIGETFMTIKNANGEEFKVHSFTNTSINSLTSTNPIINELNKQLFGIFRNVFKNHLSGNTAEVIKDNATLASYIGRYKHLDGWIIYPTNNDGSFNIKSRDGSMTMFFNTSERGNTIAIEIGGKRTTMYRQSQTGTDIISKSVDEAINLMKPEYAKLKRNINKNALLATGYTKSDNTGKDESSTMVVNDDNSFDVILPDGNKQHFSSYSQYVIDSELLVTDMGAIKDSDGNILGNFNIGDDSIRSYNKNLTITNQLVKDESLTTSAKVDEITNDDNSELRKLEAETSNIEQPTVIKPDEVMQVPTETTESELQDKLVNHITTEASSLSSIANILGVDKYNDVLSLLDNLGINIRNVIASNAATSVKNRNASYNLGTNNITIYEKWLSLDNEQKILKLIHESLHHYFNTEALSTKPEILSQVEDVYNKYAEFINKIDNEVVKAEMSKYLQPNKAERIEEFLVEAMTSRNLMGWLNQIDSTSGSKITSDTQPTLLSRLLNLISSIFESVGNINKTSLLNDINNILSNTNKSTIVETKVETEIKVEPDVTKVEDDVDMDMLDDDFDVIGSDIADAISTSITTMNDLQQSINVSNIAQYESMKADNLINFVCR